MRKTGTALTSLLTAPQCQWYTVDAESSQSRHGQTDSSQDCDGVFYPPAKCFWTPHFDVSIRFSHPASSTQCWGLACFHAYNLILYNQQ